MLGPNLAVGARNHEMTTLAPHAPLEQISHPERLPDLACFALLALAVGLDGVATDDLEVADPGEAGEDVVLDALGEECVLLVSAKVGEGKHGDAFFRDFILH